MKRFIASLLLAGLILVSTAAGASALTKYPSIGYYSWNGVWYCWYDYTFWDRFWRLNASLHDGYYRCY